MDLKIKLPHNLKFCTGRAKAEDTMPKIRLDVQAGTILKEKLRQRARKPGIRKHQCTCILSATEVAVV